MNDEPFTLRNDPPRPRGDAGEPAEVPGRQRAMFAGLGCLPGQLDLFATDGEPELDDRDPRKPHPVGTVDAAHCLIERLYPGFTDASVIQRMEKWGAVDCGPWPLEELLELYMQGRRGAVVRIIDGSGFARQLRFELCEGFTDPGQTEWDE